MKRVLVAEDDLFLANAYRIKLEKEHYEVMIAADGELTLALVKSFKPETILLDLIMPKLDGFAVLSVLKTDPATKHIKVVVMTNLGQPEDKEKAMKLGADGYFVKSDIAIGDVVKLVE